MSNTSLKPIHFHHNNLLLEEFETLHVAQPERYVGFVYLWKCIPEDMFYVGSHKGNPTDEYRGSGSRFRRVFEYYGITQFKRVILEYVEDIELLKVKEQEWMNKLGVNRSTRFYNVNRAVKSISHKP